MNKISSYSWITISPAYGRDYKNKAAAEKDFRDGKDFRLHSLEFGGSYCSIRDFVPGSRIELRYDKMRKVTSFKI